MTRLLVLRPEPGASRTVAAARARGLEAVSAPLFVVESVPWRLPSGEFDALMLTSANAVRFGLAFPPPPGGGVSAADGGGGHDALDRSSRPPPPSPSAPHPPGGGGHEWVRSLPVYAVGEATAAAAREAGLDVVYVGAGGAAALVAAMRKRGVGRALHLAGEVHRAVADPGVTIERAIVYRSVPVTELDVSPEGSVVLIHSPDAGCLFAQLVDRAGALRSRIAVVAISAAAAARLGEGWKSVAIAAEPTDAAMLAIAGKLCEEAGLDRDGRA